MSDPRDARVPILMYHSVATAPNDATRALSVAPEAFTEQMALLGDLGFTPVNTAALAECWRESKPLPRRPVLITFDDGYEGVHRHALPVLAEHGFASTLFVSTGWLRGAYDTGGALDEMLDWDQVRALAGADVEIGGHSHTHPQLDQLTDEALWFELLRCREIVADELGVRPASFAYPYGYSSGRVRRIVREAGFAQSLAVGNSLARRRQGRTRCGGSPCAAAPVSRSSSGSWRAARSPVPSPGTGPSPRGTPWSAEHDRFAGRPSVPVSDTTTAQADTPTSEAPEQSGRRLRLPGLGRSSGGSPLFRNAYALMLNTGISAVLGLGFWLAAARYYSESAVGQGSAAIAAMKLLAGLTAVTLTGALARFIPVAGRGTGRLIFRTYAGSSVVVALAAGVFLLTLSLWGSSYRFLHSPLIAVGFVGAVVAWSVLTLQDGVLTGLRSALWVPVGNTVFSAVKLVLLVAFAAAIPTMGVFVSWVAAIAVSVLPLGWLVFRRLVRGM